MRLGVGASRTLVLSESFEEDASNKLRYQGMHTLFMHTAEVNCGAYPMHIHTRVPHKFPFLRDENSVIFL